MSDDLRREKEAALAAMLESMARKQQEFEMASEESNGASEAAPVVVLPTAQVAPVEIEKTSAEPVVVLPTAQVAPVEVEKTSAEPVIIDAGAVLDEVRNREAILNQAIAQAKGDNSQARQAAGLPVRPDAKEFERKKQAVITQAKQLNATLHAFGTVDAICPYCFNTYALESKNYSPNIEVVCSNCGGRMEVAAKRYPAELARVETEIAEIKVQNDEAAHELAVANNKYAYYALLDSEYVKIAAKVDAEIKGVKWKKKRKKRNLFATVSTVLLLVALIMSIMWTVAIAAVGGNYMYDSNIRVMQPVFIGMAFLLLIINTVKVVRGR